MWRRSKPPRETLTFPTLISGNPPVAVKSIDGEVRKIVSVGCLSLSKQVGIDGVMRACFTHTARPPKESRGRFDLSLRIEDSQKYLFKNAI